LPWAVRYTNDLVSLMPRRWAQARHPAATRMNSSACSFRHHSLDLLEQRVRLSHEQPEARSWINTCLTRDPANLNHLRGRAALILDRGWIELRMTASRLEAGHRLNSAGLCPPFLATLHDGLSRSGKGRSCSWGACQPGVRPCSLPSEQACTERSVGDPPLRFGTSAPLRNGARADVVDQPCSTRPRNTWESKATVAQLSQCRGIPGHGHQSRSGWRERYSGELLRAALTGCRH